MLIDLHWLKSSNHRCTDRLLKFKPLAVSVLGVSFASSVGLGIRFSLVQCQAQSRRLQRLF